VEIGNLLGGTLGGGGGGGGVVLGGCALPSDFDSMYGPFQGCFQNQFR
jgi:hypothetical protein